MLRRGNKASAKFWRRLLLPVIERYRHLDIPKFFVRMMALCSLARFQAQSIWEISGEPRVISRASG